jgi:hypothetical protein
MTSFHTDEYIHFLARVTPDTAEELTYNGTRCGPHFSGDLNWLLIPVLKFLLGTTIPPLMGCSSSALSLQAVP